MTRDIDATYTSTIYSEDTLHEILQCIIDTKADSYFEYSIKSVKCAQEDDDYSGFIVSINASMQNTNIVIKLDISNNTLIYPDAVQLELRSLFENNPIKVMTYKLETIIAEKFETTLTRGEFNTRMRDLFDIYFLIKENESFIDATTLANAIAEVSKDRGTLQDMYEYEEIISELKESKLFNTNMKKYKDEQYPSHIISNNDIFNMLMQVGSIFYNCKSC